MPARKVSKAKGHVIEVVEWADAVADVGWMDAREELKVARIVSVGRVVQETKDQLVIAGTFGAHEHDTDTNCRIAIPKDWVQRRRKFKL